MKRWTLAVLLLAAALATSGASMGKAGEPSKDVAVVEFPQTVKLANVLLRGEYLVVHDETKMAQGEPCLYFYQSKLGRYVRPVISLHCQRVERAKADHFTVSVFRRNIPLEVPEVREIQFAGATEGHRVP